MLDYSLIIYLYQVLTSSPIIDIIDCFCIEGGGSTQSISRDTGETCRAAGLISGRVFPGFRFFLSDPKP